MADAEKLKEKLVLYLSSLSDSAQQLLLQSLENSESNGTNDAASELILSALRKVLADKDPETELSEFVKEELFTSGKVFLSQVDQVVRIEARLSPSSIDAIWQWVQRDIVTPQQGKALSEPFGESKKTAAKDKAKQICQELFPAISKYVTRILHEMGGEQKLSNQLGGEIIYSDLLDLLNCKERYEALKPSLSRIADEVPSWNSPEGEAAYSAISRYVQAAPMKAAWMFSAVTPRLKKPSMRVELACRLAGSDDAVQVAATVYAPAVNQVIADMEGYLARFIEKIGEHNQLAEAVNALTEWRLLAKAVDGELEVPAQNVWGKQVTRMKTTLSETLESEIDPAPGLIRHALRAPKSGAPEQADENLLQDAARAVELFHHAERMKDTLALNEPVGRIRKEMDQTFEILTTSLVERTRNASGNDVAVCQTLGDASILFADHLFGADYANALRRQLRAASMSAEPKAASA